MTTENQIRVNNTKMLLKVIQDSSVKTVDDNIKTILYNGDIELIHYYLKHYIELLEETYV